MSKACHIGLCIAALATPLATSATAATVRPLHTFLGEPDASTPAMPLAVNADGDFFLTTEGGGNENQGAIVELIHPAQVGQGWTENFLHSFDYTIGASSSGGSPLCRVFVDASGNIYGTATRGGAFNGGTFWKMTYDSGVGTWNFQKLYDFGACTEKGCGNQLINPDSGVIQDKNGNFYGIGANTLYQLSPTVGSTGYTLTILHVFGIGADGASPAGELTFDKKGDIFGTTYAGGINNAGTVFKLRRPVIATHRWTESLLWQFGGAGDGAQPLTGVAFADGGALFGTTCTGAFADGPYYGSAFKLAPQPGGTWAETVTEILQSSCPSGPPAFDANGNGYVTSQYNSLIYQLSGAANGPWTVQVAAALAQRDGNDPAAGLLRVGGRFYGTAEGGGQHGSFHGTVFTFHP